MNGITSKPGSLRVLGGRVLVILTASVIVLGWPASLHASRIYRPMGYYVKAAELIVLVNTKGFGPPDFKTRLKITKVLKGDADFRGKVITVSGIRSSADVGIPSDEHNVMVLLPSGAMEVDRGDVLECYTKAEDKARVKTLIDVYSIAGEGQRLSALWEHYREDGVYREQFHWDMSGIREPASLTLLERLYPEMEDKGRMKVVQLFGRTGDERALPLLIRALQDPSTYVQSRAAFELRSYYSGHPEVDTALSEAFDDGRARSQAARYLAPRRPNDPRYDAELESHLRPVHRANTAFDRGDVDKALEILLLMIEDKEEGENASAARYSRLNLAEKLLPRLDDTQRAHVSDALMPDLQKTVTGNNWIQRQDAARILRDLGTPATLAPLMALLPVRSETDRTAARIATFAIRDLGPEARREATIAVMQRIGERFGSASRRGTFDSVSESSCHPYLLQLAWLGESDDLLVAGKMVRESGPRYWKAVKPLLDVGTHVDESIYLLDLLENQPDLPPLAQAWIVYRLGDLGQVAAIDPLVELVATNRNWRVLREAQTALVRIGGPKAEKALIELIACDDPRRAERALEALTSSNLEGSIPLARRIITECDETRLKFRAIHVIRRTGSPADIKLLEPYADFWKSERGLQGTAAYAIAEIRERHNLDAYPAGATQPVE